MSDKQDKGNSLLTSWIFNIIIDKKKKNEGI